MTCKQLPTSVRSAVNTRAGRASSKKCLSWVSRFPLLIPANCPVCRGELDLLSVSNRVDFACFTCYPAKRVESGLVRPSSQGGQICRVELHGVIFLLNWV